MANNTEHIKKQLVEAMEKTLGIVSEACKLVGCGRTSYYEYYKTDSDFKSAIDNISEATLDFVESQLYKKISEGDTASILFFLKCKGKKRGYVEKTEIDISNVIKVITKDDV